jgi:uncharacterized membrane protein YjjP (DUF1212 family)
MTSSSISSEHPEYSAPPEPTKLPLRHSELTEVIDLALCAGQLLMQYGAESHRVEETVHRLGTALGCDWMDVFVATNAVQVTTVSGGEFRTKIRRVVDGGVNMTVVSGVNHLSRRVELQELDRQGVRAELDRIGQEPHHYNRWLMAGMVGLGCGAFSQLFGGDYIMLVVTMISSTIAMIVRQEMQHHRFNTLLVVIVSSFVASLIASSASFFYPNEKVNTAMTACVLLLVPGVPLINAVEDLVKGHPVVGVARGATGALITLAIALGIILAINVTGVTGMNGI